MFNTISIYQNSCRRFFSRPTICLAIHACPDNGARYFILWNKTYYNKKVVDYFHDVHNSIARNALGMSCSLNSLKDKLDYYFSPLIACTALYIIIEIDQ